MSVFFHFPGHSTRIARVQHVLPCLASTALPVSIGRLRSCPAGGIHRWGIDSPTSVSQSVRRSAGQGGAR